MGGWVGDGLGLEGGAERGEDDDLGSSEGERGGEGFVFLVVVLGVRFLSDLQESI